MCTWPAHDQPAHGDCALVGQGEGAVTTQHLAVAIAQGKMLKSLAHTLQ